MPKKNIPNKLIISFIFSYFKLLAMAFIIYLVCIITLSTILAYKYEEFVLKKESLLSFYFLIPFSLGVLIELNNEKYKKSISLIYGYLLGLFAGISLAASILYGFIFGIIILLIFILGKHIGGFCQRYFFKPIHTFIKPYISSILFNLKIIIGYIFLCTIISFLFALVFAQLQLHNSCNFGSLAGLFSHFINSFLNMISFGNIGIKADCEVISKIHLVQYFIFSLVTIIFGILLIRPKLKTQN